jgi:segregation and condensation protein B
MSLKAKLEAVIYAAEEPVTLTQLAALFAAEALEHKAAQAGVPSERSLLDGVEAANEPVAETLPLIVPEEAATEEPAPEEPAPVEVAEIAAEPSQEAATAGAEVAAENTADPAVDAESEAKREAKARDRDVRAILKGILAELIAAYEADDRGIEIREIAGGYRMATKPSCHDAVRLFVKSLKPPLKLSLPALETLAVIAYKQPVTAPEVSEIRGVESGGVLGSLMARKLIATAGRKQVIGRPILYKTTKEFLLRFGLKDLSELPSMEEFEKIAAIEIDEMEPAETAASEIASNPEETGPEEITPDEISPEETSPKAETEAAPDGSEESSSEEVRSEEGSGEENSGKESSGEEVSEPKAEEIH